MTPTVRNVPRSVRPVRWDRATVIVAVGLLATSGTVSGDDRPLSRTTHIVTLGDSITKGERSGVTAEQTFASLIESSLLVAGRPVRVTNVGIGGERTDQALARLGKVLALKPDVVTIMYGTNDSFVDQGQTASRLSR